MPGIATLRRGSESWLSAVYKVRGGRERSDRHAASPEAHRQLSGVLPLIQALEEQLVTELENPVPLRAGDVDAVGDLLQRLVR